METPFLLTNNRAELQFLAQAYPSSCQAWVFGSDTPIPAEKIGEMAALCRQFSANWSHHGTPLKVAWILHRQCFLIPVMFPGSQAGGCAQDELFQHVRTLGYMVGGNWMNPQRVSWLEEGEVKSTERILFKQLVQKGELKTDSTVFNTTLTEMGKIQEGLLETELKNSWQSQWLPKEA